MNMQNEYTIIGFYTIFVIILTLMSAGFGEAFINNADFLDADVKEDFSSDIFSTMNFLLFVDVPTTSNINNAVEIYRLVYMIVIVPYTILLAFIIIQTILP